MTISRFRFLDPVTPCLRKDQFVLDLGIFASVNFRPSKAFAKKHRKYQEKHHYRAALQMFLMLFFVCVFPSFGMLHLAYACLIMPDLKLMGGHGACANQIFDDGKCWNSAGS